MSEFEDMVKNAEKDFPPGEYPKFLEEIKQLDSIHQKYFVLGANMKKPLNENQWYGLFGAVYGKQLEQSSAPTGAATPVATVPKLAQPSTPAPAAPIASSGDQKQKILDKKKANRGFKIPNLFPKKKEEKPVPASQPKEAPASKPAATKGETWALIFIARNLLCALVMAATGLLVINMHHDTAARPEFTVDFGVIPWGVTPGLVFMILYVGICLYTQYLEAVGREDVWDAARMAIATAVSLTVVLLQEVLSFAFAGVLTKETVVLWSCGPIVVAGIFGMFSKKMDISPFAMSLTMSGIICNGGLKYPTIVGDTWGPILIAVGIGLQALGLLWRMENFMAMLAYIAATQAIILLGSEALTKWLYQIPQITWWGVYRQIAASLTVVAIMVFFTTFSLSFFLGKDRNTKSVSSWMAAGNTRIYDFCMLIVQMAYLLIARSVFFK